MSRYGKAVSGQTLLAEFKAKKAGQYQFRLYPQLWKSPELARYYTGRRWDVVKFEKPPPALPDAPGIYMFVVGPYCGGLKDHSYIFYVGKAKSIKTRYSNYLDEKEGKGFNPREEVMLFLNNFDGYLFFHYIQVPEAELTQAEDLLKNNLTPVANDQIPIIGKLTTP
jgi:hypothetical protein